MGSTRRSEFKPGGRLSPHPRAFPAVRRAKPPKSSQTKGALHDALDHFSTGLAIVETTARALEAAQNEGQCSATGSEVATLRYGVTALRAVHEEFDLAIAKVSP